MCYNQKKQPKVAACFGVDYRNMLRGTAFSAIVEESCFGSEVIMSKKLWNKNYILLLQSSVVSSIGDLMYSVAIGYWVYTRTESSALMGIMSAISMLVTMVLSPFGGSIVDKLKRKWVLVLGDLFQGAIMLSVGILAYTDKLTVPGVLLAAFLASFGGVFYSPASSTIMIDIIPKDDMVRGQSIYSGAVTLVNLIGSSFSGVMVAFFGVPLIIVINGLSNIYAAISETLVKVPQTAQEGKAVTLASVLRDTGLAIRTVFSDPCLKLFVPFALVLNLLSAGAFSLILPFITEKGFGVEEYGYLMSISTAASLIGVVVLGAVKLSPKIRFRIMSFGFILSEISLLAGYLSKSFSVLCVFAFFGMLLNTAGNSVFSAALMLALPEENRGAMLGFITSATVGGTALSSLIYGFLGDIFPLSIVFAVGAALTLIPMTIVMFNRRTRDFVLTH